MVFLEVGAPVWLSNLINFDSRTRMDNLKCYYFRVKSFLICVRLGGEMYRDKSNFYELRQTSTVPLSGFLRETR